MSASVKIWILVALLLILAGGVVFCIAMGLNGWDFTLLGGGKAEEREEILDADFRSIFIETDEADVRLVLSQDGRCRAVIRDSESRRHTLQVEDGVLKLRSEDSRKWYQHFSLFSLSSEITLYLPRTAYESLTVKTDTGDTEIPGDFTFGAISVTADTGDAECRASCTGKLTVTTGTGDITLQNLSAGEAALTVSTGRVEVKALTCEGDLSLTVGTGRATLTEVTCRNFASAGGTGDLTLREVLAEESITVSRSTGDVKFSGCDARELTVETGTGDVTGTLRSAKVFLTKTGTGRVRVPDTATGGTCRITTSTGDIEIEIQ